MLMISFLKRLFDGNKGVIMETEQELKQEKISEDLKNCSDTIAHCRWKMYVLNSLAQGVSDTIESYDYDNDLFGGDAVGFFSGLQTIFGEIVEGLKEADDLLMGHF